MSTINNKPDRTTTSGPPDDKLPVADDAPMTSEDYARLDSLEERIDTGWDEKALALGEIKDDKLYRRTRDGEKQTWDQYCQSVRHITPQWANTLIERAETLKLINQKSETPVSLSPTAIGHLEGLDTDEQVEIVQEVIRDGKKPTAKNIADKMSEKGGSKPEDDENDQEDGTDSEADAKDKNDEENSTGTSDEAASDKKKWERKVAKAEAEAAKSEAGGDTEPDPALYKVTVLVFSESDQAAVHEALSNWSPTTKSLGGSKQLRSMSANASAKHIGTLLQKLGKALEGSKPKNVRVSIGL